MGEEELRPDRPSLPFIAASNGSDPARKILIYHKDDYFSDVLKALAPCPSVAVKNDTEFRKALSTVVTHVLLCEDRLEELQNILEALVTQAKTFPVVTIFTFTRKDTLKKTLKDHFPGLQKLIETGIIRHSRLPCRLEMVLEAFSLDIPIDQRDNLLAPALGEIRSHLARVQDSSLRHLMGNSRAAARLLFGAGRSGLYKLAKDVELNRFKGCFDAIVQHEFKSSSELREQRCREFDNFVSTMRQLPTEKAEEPWHHPIKKILVVEDQIEMWKPVWAFIFSEEKIDIMPTGGEALQKLTADLSYDFALIDIYLGDSQPSGIEVLRCIRKNVLDLPIVMLTAYDDAELTRTCYELGASFYFVKEREDREDRDSLKYFAAFRDMILQLKPYRLQERELARRFQAIELPLQFQSRESAEAICKALFFLLLDPEETGARRFLGGPSLYTKAAFYAHRSVERWVDCELKRSGITEIDGEKIENKSLSKKIAYGIQAKILPKEASFLLATELCTKCGGMGHLKSKIEDRNQGKLKSLALKSCEEALMWFEKVSLMRSVQLMDTFPGQPINLSFPKILSTGTPRMRHSERELAGANRILWGAYLHFGSDIAADRKNLGLSVDDIIAMEGDPRVLPWPEPSQYSCLFIDDEGEASGWKRCLEVLLPDIGVHYLEYKAGTDLKEVLDRAQMADFVILDLKLPDRNGAKSEQIGLGLLEEVNKAYPALPVVILTACDDALTFRRVVTRGAFDSFPKTNQECFDIDDDRYFTRYYVRLCSVIDKVRRYLDRGAVQTYQGIRFVEHNPFWSLDFIKVGGKLYKETTAGQSLLGAVGELTFSELVSALVREAFLRAFYLSGKSYSPTVGYLITRLYLTYEGSTKPDGPQYDAVMGAGEAAEFLIKIIAGLYYHERDMEKVTGGEIIFDSSFYHFRSTNHDLIENFEKLWDLRKRGKGEQEVPDGCKYLMMLVDFTGDIALQLLKLLSKQMLDPTIPLVFVVMSKFTLYSKFFQAILKTGQLRMVMEGLLSIFQREASGEVHILSEVEKRFLQMFLSILIGSSLYTRTSKILDSRKTDLESYKSRRWNETGGKIKKLREMQAEKTRLLAKKKELEDQLEEETSRKEEVEKQLEKYYSKMGAETGSTVRKGPQSLQFEFEKRQEKIKMLNAEKVKNKFEIDQNKQAIKVQVAVLQRLFKDLGDLRKKEAEIRRIGREITKLEWRKKYCLLLPVEEHVNHLERLFGFFPETKPDRIDALSNMKTALQRIRSLLDLSKYKSLGEFFSRAQEVLEALDDREINVRLKGRFFKADIPGTRGWVFELSGTDEKILVEVEGFQTEDANGEIEIFWDRIRREPSFFIYRPDSKMTSNKS